MNKKALFSSATEEWPTPDSLFKSLDDEFHFTLDPCSTHQNAKCEKHFTINENGLAQSWAGERVFCNPPYGRVIKKWVEKCATEKAECVCLIIPARTDTTWFHDYIYGKAEIRFLKGRLKFGGAKNNAPFPSMIAIFRGSDHERESPEMGGKADPQDPAKHRLCGEQAEHAASGNRWSV